MLASRDGLRARTWFGRFLHVLTTSRSTLCLICIGLLAFLYTIVKFVISTSATPADTGCTFVHTQTSPNIVSGTSETEWTANGLKYAPEDPTAAGSSSQSNTAFTLATQKHKYLGSPMFARDQTLYPPAKVACKPVKDQPCACHTHWAVIASGNGIVPDMLDTQLARMRGWCAVVVGDKDTPSNYWRSNARMIYLAPEDQRVPPLSRFRTSQLLPWSHAARKNLGYLYALMHGAKVIFDTEASVKLEPIPFEPSHYEIPTTLRPADMVQAWSCKSSDPNQPTQNMSSRVLNPHPLFGQGSSWPRGFPLTAVGESLDESHTSPCISELEDSPAQLGVSATHHMLSWEILDLSHTNSTPDFADTKVSRSKSRCYTTSSKRKSTRKTFPRVGVIQSLIQGQPDFDAVYTATTSKGNPYTFATRFEQSRRRSKAAESHDAPYAARGYRAITPAPGIYVPINSRATVVRDAALWSLLIPSTVSSNVADIWRGYISQKIYSYADISIAVHEPFVRRTKAHAVPLSAQLGAESDLALRTEALITFLDEWIPGTRLKHHNSKRERKTAPAVVGANSENSAGHSPPGWFSNWFTGGTQTSATKDQLQDAWAILQDSRSPSLSVPAVMEELYMELAERGLLGSKDVQLTQAWLEDLLSLGYQFPELCGAEPVNADVKPSHSRLPQIERPAGTVFLLVDEPSTIPEDSAGAQSNAQNLPSAWYERSLVHAIRESLKLTQPSESSVFVLTPGSSPFATDGDLRSNVIDRSFDGLSVPHDAREARLKIMVIHSRNLLHLDRKLPVADAYWKQIFPVYWMPRLARMIGADLSLAARIPVDDVPVCVTMRTPLPQEDVFYDISRSGVEVAIVLDKLSLVGVEKHVPIQSHEPESLATALVSYDAHTSDPLLHDSPVPANIPLAGGYAELVSSKIFTSEYFGKYLNMISAARHLAVPPQSSTETTHPSIDHWDSVSVKSNWVRRGVSVRKMSLSPDRLKVSYHTCSPQAP